MRELLLKLCRRQDLTRDEARDAFMMIMSGNATEAQIGGLLIGLAAKGTTVDELVGAASVMREKSITIEVGSNQPVLDTCGTGGDIKGTFNISTAAALVVAATGVKVAKHGNRSASGRTGSADVLEKLGVKLDLAPQQLIECLDRTNLCFAFARSHHPAMKFVSQARASLGIPSIFNLLGPLVNPARARHQLIGVFAPELTDRLASVLRELGSERAWVVHADDGLDEISTLGPTRVSELLNGHVKTWSLDPKALGLPYARLSDLQVDSLDTAAEALRIAISGDKGPLRDITLLNAAAALVIAGKCSDLPHGLLVAADVVDDGLAEQTLDKLILVSNSEQAD